MKGECGMVMSMTALQRKYVYINMNLAIHPYDTWRLENVTSSDGYLSEKSCT